MRVPLRWLLEYCDPGLNAEQIAERLDLTGTELERLERVGVPSTDGFVVGKVIAAEKHPDADRLTVCTVDDGSGSERTIVCGAPNVAAGQTVAVALPGATMPDGTKLGEAKLRGVKSSGMILAEDEVGIGERHDGIMVLSGDLAAGSPLAEALPIADEVLELEITPNRPDCLSIYGIAREVHAAAGGALAEPPWARDAEPAGSGRAEDHASVEIADPGICLRFTARVFEDVKVGPSPEWLKQRLTAAGQRPISNVVDITNYVMLATGQPLHAFDLDEVRGSAIVVRKATAGETMVTLDGTERAFDPEMALVCDAEGPSGVAGIMGGRVSEVSERTTRVLMEAATWVGPNILRTSKELGLRSEASARFEKQLHPENAIAGQQLAARLMVELCGARMVGGTIDVYPSPAPPRVVRLRPARVERLLGLRIGEEEIQRILGSLGFEVVGEQVTVPWWRDADVRREADLIEEVARVYGLDKLPTTLPARKHAVGRLTPSQRLRRRLEDALRDRGLDEIVAFSFTSHAALAKLRLGDRPALALANPMSEDGSLMRPLLLPALLDAARHNASRGAGKVALFESAHAYEPDGSLDVPEGRQRGQVPAKERHHLAGLIVGGGYFAVKGLVEALFAVAGVELEVAAEAQPFLHPGKAASINEGLGWIGELHPQAAAEWDLGPAAGFELDFDALAEIAGATPSYEEVPQVPAVLQDIAVVTAADVSASTVIAAVREGGGDLLARAEVFDSYEGEQLGEGNRSLALRLEFRARDRTLTDDEVAQRREAIEKALEGIGGRLRA